MGGRSSGDLLLAHCEDLQESEAAEIFVTRFQCQEVFAKSSYEYPCANGTLKFLNSPRTSSKAEGNLEPEGDDDIEEGDRQEVSPNSETLFSDIMMNFEPSCTTQTKKHSRTH